MRAPSQPKLPALLKTKIYKTGQTRGADDDEIYQNRILRSGTVLIPYSCYDACYSMLSEFRNGYIFLIDPSQYFGVTGFVEQLRLRGIVLGENALLFYETRLQWLEYNPEEKGLTYATSRIRPLGGHYIARIPSTTASPNIRRGFTETSLKGAGIRVYEYASDNVIDYCKHQLELIYWRCFDAEAISVAAGMTPEEVRIRKSFNNATASGLGLADLALLIENRILNSEGFTVCPLCLEPLSALGFYNKLAQALGRDVHDLTVTELNLFHIKELRVGELNHKPYNLGWGHHHCNTVTKDAGIMETLEWMRQVLSRN